MAQSSPASVVLHYVLPVLWMTSRLAVMGGMAICGDTGVEPDVYECLLMSDIQAAPECPNVRN